MKGLIVKNIFTHSFWWIFQKKKTYFCFISCSSSRSSHVVIFFIPNLIFLALSNHFSQGLNKSGCWEVLFLLAWSKASIKKLIYTSWFNKNSLYFFAETSISFQFLTIWVWKKVNFLHAEAEFPKVFVHFSKTSPGKTMLDFEFPIFYRVRASQAFCKSTFGKNRGISFK